MKHPTLALLLLAAPLLAAPLLATVVHAEEPVPAPTPCAEPTAAESPSTVWRPALYLLGTAERGSGAAYAPPLDRLKRDDAASVALGLDFRRALQAGRLEASAFALAHDPASAADRGFFLAARGRGVLRLGDGAWTLRGEDSARLQRRENVDVSDFERNELWIEIARRVGTQTIGLRVSDRRRWVRNDPLQAFARQWLSASLSGGSPGHGSWRFEVGPQYYDTKVGTGWRIASALEAMARVLKAQIALRLLWIEPLDDGASNKTAGLTTPSPTTRPGSPAPDTLAPTAVPQFSPPPQLVGPVLVVDPLDGDETDWDFGRRKQELRLVLAGRLPGEIAAGLELRAQRERGPDLTVIGPSVDVERDRFAVRGSLRRPLGTRLALLAEGSWQRVHDNRAGFSHSRTIVAIGIELRP